jgi:hypothetical protein
MHFNLSLLTFAFLIIGAIAAPAPKNYIDLELETLDEHGG